MNTTDEWIQQRSGIKERHYAEVGTGSSDLAYEAALKAIDNAQIDKCDIDFIIAATFLQTIISQESVCLFKQNWGL